MPTRPSSKLIASIPASLTWICTLQVIATRHRAAAPQTPAFVTLPGRDTQFVQLLGTVTLPAPPRRNALARGRGRHRGRTVRRDCGDDSAWRRDAQVPGVVGEIHHRMLQAA